MTNVTLTFFEGFPYLITLFRLLVLDKKAKNFLSLSTCRVLFILISDILLLPLYWPVASLVSMSSISLSKHALACFLKSQEKMRQLPLVSKKSASYHSWHEVEQLKDKWWFHPIATDQNLSFPGSSFKCLCNSRLHYSNHFISIKIY